MKQRIKIIHITFLMMSLTLAQQCQAIGSDVAQVFLDGATNFGMFLANMKEIKNVGEQLWNVTASEEDFSRTYGTLEKLPMEQEVRLRNILKKMGLPNADIIKLRKIHQYADQFPHVLNSDLIIFDQATLDALKISEKEIDFLAAHEGAHVLHHDIEKALVGSVAALFVAQMGVRLVLHAGNKFFADEKSKETPLLWELAKPILAPLLVKLCAGLCNKMLSGLSKNCECSADKAAVRVLGLEGAAKFFQRLKDKYGDYEGAEHPKVSVRLQEVEKEVATLKVACA